jgi:hypothetical protein
VRSIETEEESMPRKPHPADAFNAGIVATATAWSAFTQAAGRITRHFQTDGDALGAAQVMADAFRRPALVYAIGAQGRSAVAYTVQPSNHQAEESTMSTTSKTYAKRFNAQRAARKLLGEAAREGEAFRTFKAPNGEWDFKTLTTTAPAAPGSASAAPEPEEAGEALPQPVALTTRAAASTSKRAAIEEAARGGTLPTPPDFSAATHARFRTKLAKLIAMAEAGDAEGLKAVAINPVSTSPRAMARYRDLAVMAIEARVNPLA